MKKNNKKGFTLAELLIVVAIIAVLVAIAIPVFTTQLKNAQLATDAANVRSKYAEIVVDSIDKGSATVSQSALQAVCKYSTVTVDGTSITVSLTGASKSPVTIPLGTGVSGS